MTIQKNLSAHAEIIKHAKAVARARKLLQMAERRNVLFPELGLPDPAWHILLDLLVKNYEGRHCTLEGICKASKLPFATGSRYINHLAHSGMITRVETEPGHPEHHVALATDAHAKLVDLLSEAEISDSDVNPSQWNLDRALIST